MCGYLCGCWEWNSSSGRVVSAFSKCSISPAPLDLILKQRNKQTNKAKSWKNISNTNAARGKWVGVYEMRLSVSWLWHMTERWVEGILCEHWKIFRAQEQLIWIGPHKGTCTATFCRVIWRFVPWGLLIVKHAHLQVDECFLWELLGCRTAEYVSESPLWSLLSSEGDTSVKYLHVQCVKMCIHTHFSIQPHFESSDPVLKNYFSRFIKLWFKKIVHI